jgi:drug/metabolite transporter (DMT)-like permease
MPISTSAASAPPRPEAANAPVAPALAGALLALVVVLWGVNWPVMKAGLAYIPPLHFALGRMALGAATMLVVAALAGQLRWPARQDWPVVFSVGVLQMGLFMALVNFGLQFVGAGRAAVLAYTTPLWVVPLAAVLLRERLTRARGAGITLGLAGLAVLFNPLHFAWGDGRVLLGNGLLLLGALVWAVLIVQVRGHRFAGTPLSLAPFQFLVACALLGPAALAFEAGAPVRWGPELGLILLYNGPVATAFCFWAMLTVTRALPAATTALGTLGVPAVGIVSGALALGEPLTPSVLGGFGLIVGGLAVVALADRAPRT